MRDAIPFFLFLATLSIVTKAQDTVHVVFKTHLDIGFTDFAPKVLDKYFNEFIPMAIETAERLEKENSNEKFIWTSAWWFLWEYLNQAPQEKKQRLEKAINDGYIVWNAYPFTGGSELLDTSLFRFSISQAMKMDRRYGKKTMAAKITDVAGETIGVVPILHEYGIKLLHIGVNQASPRAETPQVFLWRDRVSGSEIVVVYENSYGDVTIIPGFHHILQFAFTGDNHGPQSPETVKKIYAQLHKKYPNAVIKASTLNDYANEVWKFRNHLPVIDKEIGSTWIHSAGTDPVKYASLRALMRLRDQWLKEKRVDPTDSDFIRFSTWVLMLSEHTGGLDEKKYIDFDHYTVDELKQVMDTEGYRDMVQSWDDERKYIQKAVDALGNSPLADEARFVLAEIVSKRPELKNFKPFEMDKGLMTKHFFVQFNPVNGSVLFLSDTNKKNVLVDGSVPFGLFWHESFNEEDYRLWAKEGLILTALTRYWVFEDFCKPNIDNHGAVSAKNLPVIESAFIKENEEETTVLMKAVFNPEVKAVYGLPAENWIRIDFPKQRKEIRYSLQWFDKEASRLPDAYWLSIGFKPEISKTGLMEKVGRPVSPTEVVEKGGRHLHGVYPGISYTYQNSEIIVESLDCPIVSPGEPVLFDKLGKLPDPGKGWHFNLLNNKWGTNFRTWYDDDAKFRFVVRFEK